MMNFSLTTADHIDTRLKKSVAAKKTEADQIHK